MDSENSQPELASTNVKKVPAASVAAPREVGTRSTLGVGSTSARGDGGTWKVARLAVTGARTHPIEEMGCIILF